MGNISHKIDIKGLVQGVGFRPFIYRLAMIHQLRGTVENNNQGVQIVAEGLPYNIGNFTKDIYSQLPQAAHISSFEVSRETLKNYKDFQIIKSQSYSSDITEVSPDIAVCEACLSDMKTQAHRRDYPLTNCTNCGPRFSIIQGLPYDRPKTTMKVFPLCHTCHKEYNDVLDRRFHAQPVACNTCGPKYTLHVDGRKETDIQSIINTSATLLEQGKIMAIKGMGGYHLACDALNEETVTELRRRKNREGKPFALMFKDSDAAAAYLHINDKEKQLLTCWRRPIVLLGIKKPLAASVSIGLHTVGAMLPYMPFHHMLFDRLQIPALVLTSGNTSDEPIVIEDSVALEKLGPISDAVITYNRHIFNRTDDSVTHVTGNKSRLIRRSRGYAPSPITLSMNTEGIFAGGAELANCFCIGKGEQAILSQHIGDLKNMETLAFYEESATRFQQLFRFKPELGAIDMHPDYLSSQYIRALGIPTTEVQHHHAHIASCMAEHNLDEKIIGISFDGTGYGDDGNIWGGEFLICDLNSYHRSTHFEYVAQPGGDAVSRHPWRMMFSYLQHYYGDDVTIQFPDIFKGIDPMEIETLLFMIKNKVNCPLTSSAGRLFDAVSALLGVCRHSAYHAEAPMRLEAIAHKDEPDHYPFGMNPLISFEPCFRAMIADLKRGVSRNKIAGRFHNTIVEVVVQGATEIRRNTGLNKVVLSGGSFQNSLLLQKAEIKLNSINFETYTQESIPSNDGGLALGQLAIAAKRRNLGFI